MATQNSSPDIKLTRVYEAPVAAVWAAWTDPEQAARWWGPRGFTITTHSKDLRVGGHWHYTMHGPDGRDYPNKTIYRDVVPLERLVYDHGGDDERPPLFRVTVLFKNLGDRTEMQMTMTCPSPEAAAATRGFIKDAGGNSTWDRLAEYLEKERSERDVFTISRSFEAPIEALFEMWSKATSIARWLGPNAARMDFIDEEIALGKTTFYTMSYDSGLVMHGKMSYLKIERPTELAYTQIFCDAKGGLARHPLVPIWPECLLTRVLFAREGKDSARATLIWEPHGIVSPAEREAFIQMKPGMSQGWTQAFDKLDQILAAS